MTWEIISSTEQLTSLNKSGSFPDGCVRIEGHRRNLKNSIYLREKRISEAKEEKRLNPLTRLSAKSF